MGDLSTTYQKTLEEAGFAEDLAFFGIGQPQVAPAAPAPKTQGAPAAKEEPKAETEDPEKGLLNSVGSFLKELPEQALGGVFDAVNNTIDTARDVGEAVGIPNYSLQITNEAGDFDPMFLSPEEVEEKGGLKPGIVPKMDAAETTAGGFTRAITQFATGFIPASKGAKALGIGSKAIKGLVAGAAADAVVQDPHAARLSTLLNEVPALEAIIPDFMADTNPENESAWDGRLKNALEGLVVGGASEALVGGTVKMIKGYKAMKNAPKAAMTAEEAILEEGAAIAAKADAAAEAADAIPVKEFDMGPEDVLNVDPKGKTFINHSRIESSKDVHDAIQNLADRATNTGSTTHGEVVAASAAEYKNISDLLGREVKRPFTSTEAVAAREIMTTSADEVAKLARIANDPMASPADMFKFKRAIEVHSSIQEVVLEGRKATAQSLNSWKIPSGSSKARNAAIVDMMERGGKDSKKLAKMISETVEAGGNVSEAIAKTKMKKWGDAYYQVWINGLLSSPATHAANVASNAATTVMAIPERYVSAAFEAMKGSNGSAFIEANARAAGFFSGIGDGFRAMTGDGGMLKGASKLEKPVDAISAAAWGKPSNSTIGMGLDYIGKAIGMPGWALEKGDMFFKGINSRMMLQEKAAKTAFEEGLQGKAFKTRVADLVTNPTEPMMNVASDFANYQTFTNETGPIAQAVSKLREATPYGAGKYVVPFINTPANILNYGFERTPIAPLMSRYREAIKEGGTAAATARAKMAGGTMLMASIAPFALSGNVTGAGPANYRERIALEQTGWKPYSVKVGGKYISYERMEPMSTLIGYSADLTSIMGQLHEDEAGELIAAGAAAMANNMTNKTFLSGITEFTSVVTSNSPGRWSNYFQRMGAGFAQPVMSSAAKKVGNYFDPVKRDFKPDDVNGTLKSLWARATEAIPGFGQDAPPLRDVWGDEMRYDHGVAPVLEAVSPIKIYKEDKDPVNKMIADNKIPLSLPSRKVMGVNLTNQEYSRYCELAGKKAKETIDKFYHSGGFKGMSGGADGRLADAIGMIINKSRKYAQGQIIKGGEFDLEDRIIEFKQEQKAKMMGE